VATDHEREGWPPLRPPLADPEYTPNRASLIRDKVRRDPSNAEIRQLALSLAHNRRLTVEQIINRLTSLED
jgi:hypothetical protein